MTLIAINPLGDVEVDTAKFTKKIDYVSGTNPIYIGEAKPGTVTSAPYWAIQKLTYDGNNNVTDVQWSSGSSQPQFIWDNRASYTYS